MEFTSVLCVRQRAASFKLLIKTSNIAGINIRPEPSGTLLVQVRSGSNAGTHDLYISLSADVKYVNNKSKSIN